MIKIETGAPVVAIHLQNLPAKFERGVRQGWFDVGDALVSEASRAFLEKPKGGRVYRVRRGNRMYRHRASAPGETPANLSGKLRRSLGFQLRGWSEMEFGYRDTTGVPYGKFLELGTQKMAPRPGLGNAVKAEERNILNFLERGIAGEISQ